MIEWKYEGRYCHDCGNYSIIIGKCEKGHHIYFEGGCKGCGTARPSKYIFDRKDCEDFFWNPNMNYY